MKIRSSNLLQLPSGAAGLFLQDARLHQEAVQKLNRLYALWGYRPVHTPMADYAQVYDEMIPDQDARRVYHLIDRDGEVLMLRWDTTLFLVKQIRSLASRSEEPLRISYADFIMRHEDTEDISRNEFFQTGIELIGQPGPEGDLEVLLLLRSAFQTLELRPSYHIGSHRLFDLAAQGLSRPDQGALAQAVRLRDRREILSLLGPGSEALADLFALICPGQDLAASLEPFRHRLPADLWQEVQTMAAFIQAALELEPDMDIHLDCSELGSQNYHSGIVFQAYLPGLSVPAAAGGRYDKLMERLDCPRPAIGFSIMLSRLLGLLPNQPVSIPQAAGQDFKTRYRQARELRNQGKSVRI